MTAALAPHAWRAFTERMLVRRALGALDECCVVRFLGTIPGTDVGGVGVVEPVDAADERVDVLVQALSATRWREWTLARLSAALVSSVEAWQTDRERIESDLRRLLDGP